MALDVSLAVDAVPADSIKHARVDRESARRVAVADVEIALTAERAAVHSVEGAQRRLDVAMADLDVHAYAAATASELEVMVREAEQATHARLLAVVAQARGRGALAAAVSVLGALWDDEATLDEIGPSQVTARTAGELGLDAAYGISLHGVDQSAAVVAEATAIALAADAQVAAEMKASAIQAARTTKAAVRAAALTVAQAAESARAEQEAAVADAAARVAADVIRTAIDVQARAEHWAAAESFAAFSRAVVPRTPTDLVVAKKMAEHAADAAAARARETALAAEVVAIMVAASAAAVADAADTLAAATARHVRHSARAVQAVADAAARGVAASTAEAARAAAKAAAQRHSADQLSGWDPGVTPKPATRFAKKKAAACAVAAAAFDVRRHTSAMAVAVGAPAAARAHVARVLHANQVAEDVLEVVEMLVSEVVSNVVRHQSSRVVEVEVAVDVYQAVTVTVSGGEGLASVALVNPPGRPDPASESGRGLEMLDSLASVWGTRREYRTTVVWFTVRPAEPAADSAGG